MIIAFTGQKEVGKSAACSHIESIHPDAVRINFKDGLIDELKSKYGLTLHALAKRHGRTVDELFTMKPYPEGVRELMKDHGQMRRDEYADYWVDIWFPKAQQALKEGKLVTVDDARYPNEADASRELGGVVVYLTRPDMKSTDNHPSETEMKNIEADYYIDTMKGDLPDLHEKVEQVLNEVCDADTDNMI